MFERVIVATRTTALLRPFTVTLSDDRVHQLSRSRDGLRFFRSRKSKRFPFSSYSNLWDGNRMRLFPAAKYNNNMQTNAQSARDGRMKRKKDETIRICAETLE